MSSFAYIIDIKKGFLNTYYNKIGKLLLTNNIIQYLLIPHQIKNNVVQYSLVKDVDKVKDINLSIMPINAARLVSQLTIKKTTYMIGCFLRNCEIKAVIELYKLKMVNLDNLFIIGVDCEGTYTQKEAKLRKACEVCSDFIPTNSNMNLCSIGIDENKLIIEVKDKNVLEAINKEFELKEYNDATRENIIASLRKDKEKNKKNLIDTFTEKINNFTAFIDEFSYCVKCYNCKEVCPICYCRYCIFTQPIFEYEPYRLLEMVDKKGIVSLPKDKIMYHLTRLTHTGLSCVNCGLCSSYCPEELPVFELFLIISDKLQQLFDYKPGRSITEQLPIVTFKEDEFKEIG